jgi:hypothetical protein
MKKIITLFVLALILIPTAFTSQVFADDQDSKYYRVRTITLEYGTTIDEIVINGPPTPPVGYERITVELPEPHPEVGLVTWPVPAYDWSFGCSATSAAMIAAFYDRADYPDMYTGPTNGGVMPMDNSVWPDWKDSYGDTRHQCPLSATHNGLDGRTTNGHVDDYWVGYGSTDPDPFIGNWPEHTYGDCTGDYMKTNQSTYGNTDGSTTFYNFTNGAPLYDYQMEGYGINDDDGGYGFKLFYESRGYTVDTMYNQYIDALGLAYGFTYAQYCAEIDAGRPVMIHLEGHTMVGVGYDDTSSDLMYINDTWDYETHTMTWGGSYYGMAHIGVTIAQLAEGGLYNSVATGNWHTGSTWDAGSVPGTNGAATVKASHTVTVDSNAQCHDLTVESGGTLVVPDGVTLSVADDLVNSGTLQQTQDVNDSSNVSFFNTGGYGGVILNANGTDLGSTVVNIKGNQDCTATAGETVKRCFNIAPTNTSDGNATITFYFDSSEITGTNSCNTLNAYHWNGSSWDTLTLDTDYDGDGRLCGTDPQSVRVTGVSSFSSFVLKSGGPPSGGPTAVTLASFTAALRRFGVSTAGGVSGFVLSLVLVALGAIGLLALRARRRP